LGLGESGFLDDFVEGVPLPVLEKAEDFVDFLQWVQPLSDGFALIGIKGLWSFFSENGELFSRRNGCEL
jgi:hypothetical protein